MQPDLFDPTFNLGITGTKRGGTVKQLEKAQERLKKMFTGGFKNLHHGDCIGFDAQIHEIALPIGFCITIHPPRNSSRRAFCKGACLVLPTKDYLDRNHDIVKESESMIAGPGEVEEQLRSGTWATIRYAKKSGVCLEIIFPDGSMIDV